MISTVPPDRLAKLLPDRLHATDARTANLDAFESSPILGVHLHLERRITDLPHLVLAGRPVHWMFNKGIDEDGHQHLHAVISAADDWMELSEEEIVHRVVDELARAFPCIKDTDRCWPLDPSRRSVPPSRQRPIESKRPSAGPSVLGVDGGDLQGLYLAGDWCDTGWPATMEGAVRSGYNAAAAINGDGGLVDELPRAHWPRLLGLR